MVYFIAIKFSLKIIAFLYNIFKLFIISQFLMFSKQTSYFMMSYKFILVIKQIAEFQRLFNKLLYFTTRLYKKKK